MYFDLQKWWSPCDQSLHEVLCVGKLPRSQLSCFWRLILDRWHFCLPIEAVGGVYWAVSIYG
jgi:hypothetical protein